MRGEVTRRQREVLAFIARHCSANGFPPTLREISNAFGWGSVLSARCHIDALVDHGLLRRHAKTARGLTLVRQAVAS